tara:strand:- start:106 stop:360 length:255 start_codon:yes stop_codon:yes gene_type:complete
VLDKNIIKESGKNKNDTGSTSVQISHFTQRINKINEHLKLMKKDHSSRRGLLILVSKRRKLLKYLKKTNLQEFISLTEKLNIRK